MSRHFRIEGNELRSARSLDQLGTPGAVVGVISSKEDWMRVVQRVYQLGRKDKAADIAQALGTES